MANEKAKMMSVGLLVGLLVGWWMICEKEEDVQRGKREAGQAA